MSLIFNKSYKNKCCNNHCKYYTSQDVYILIPEKSGFCSFDKNYPAIVKKGAPCIHPNLKDNSRNNKSKKEFKILNNFLNLYSDFKGLENLVPLNHSLS